MITVENENDSMQRVINHV